VKPAQLDRLVKPDRPARLARQVQRVKPEQLERPAIITTTTMVSLE
jgi:hypothetical protein